MDDLRQDLYKALKAESATYNDKIQTLWLTKFSLSGAVVAFVLINRDRIDSLADATLAGVALIPVLSLIIDLKVAEYGLHVRAISRFIARTFDDHAVMTWEGVLWGDASSPELHLVRFRSMLTVLAAALPTLAMILLASLIFAQAGFVRLSLTVGGGMIVVYVAALVAATITIFRPGPAKRVQES